MQLVWNGKPSEDPRYTDDECLPVIDLYVLSIEEEDSGGYQRNVKVLYVHGHGVHIHSVNVSHTRKLLLSLPQLYTAQSVPQIRKSCEEWAKLTATTTLTISSSCMQTESVSRPNLKTRSLSSVPLMARSISRLVESRERTYAILNGFTRHHSSTWDRTSPQAVQLF